MKILIVNQSDNSGGAAVAAMRMALAMQGAGAEVRMLVHMQNTSHDFVSTPYKSAFYKHHAFFNFALERFHFLFHEKNKDVRFAFSSAITGHDITSHPYFVWADVVHLHWTNFGLLSLGNLSKVFESGKKVVWTMHDMWAFTGGCHYAGSCRNYIDTCGDCLYLKRPAKHDLSARLLQRKIRIIAGKKVAFVTPSNWLKNIANTSAVLRNEKIHHICNTLDMEFFTPGDKSVARANLGIQSQKKLILFGAMSVKDKRKGFEYLHEALLKLSTQFPESVNEYALLVFGKSNPEMFAQIPYEIINLTYLSTPDKIRDAYRSADVFVIPSVEDNLPNTIVEAHACGIPVVGFRLAGIEEMIVHQSTGFLAEGLSSLSLANGIHWVLSEADIRMLQLNARQYAVQNYHPSVIVPRMLELYQSLL